MDDCNADGYANSIYTITVNAIDQSGSIPFYAEPCAAAFVRIDGELYSVIDGSLSLSLTLIPLSSLSHLS